MINRGIQSQLP